MKTNEELTEALENDWLTKEELTSAINSLMFPKKWEDKKAFLALKEKVEEQKEKRVELQKSNMKREDMEIFFNPSLKVKEKEETVKEGDEITEKVIDEVEDIKVKHLTEKELMGSDKDVLRALADELAGSNDELEKAPEDAEKEDLTKYILINSK